MTRARGEGDSGGGGRRVWNGAAAQWCGAAGLDRWVGRWRCTLSPARPPPAPAVSLPLLSPSRRTRKKGNVGCVSVPRKITATAAAELAAPPEGDAETEEEGIECEECNGAGWLLYDFCKGKKNNVKSESSRIYRRCPTCKAAGYILCPRCRVHPACWRRVSSS